MIESEVCALDDMQKRRNIYNNIPFIEESLKGMKLSLFINEVILSTIIGAIAFSCFWSIWELFQQEKRVVRGWFPENPKRHEYYQSIRNNK